MICGAEAEAVSAWARGLVCVADEGMYESDKTTVGHESQYRHVSASSEHTCKLENLLRRAIPLSTVLIQW